MTNNMHQEAKNQEKNNMCNEGIKNEMNKRTQNTDLDYTTVCYFKRCDASLKFC